MSDQSHTVEINVDPLCPFAWVASRWLDGVAERRGVSVAWKQMSLAVLNEGQELDAERAARMEISWRAGRLLAAAADASDVKDLYMAIGRRLHTEGLEFTDELARSALVEVGSDPSLVSVMNDASRDDAVRKAHRLSQEALGGTAGTPIIVIDGRAFFGPVLTEIPSPSEADRLFDALTTLAGIPAFAQMERPMVGPPNLQENF
ncbi:mycothiol-dependent nitroreductase Rv2466c family protein [Gordonia rhizosphera]|uniref:Uncharacterized protein n=1 Tax=Gordonia rhizosphera NBRC 16068 TaxID=1108045 RepID=K6W5B7_9ACTN|nr:DsbA family protein [Gordonia rhizosphera]GAB88896.1 hypothetical protein GORHZ_046_00460 [Gordonia rhizosphera NBRC 16068]